jgi:hypothetical protein
LEQWEPDSHPVTFSQGEHKPLWGEDGFTFDDVLDMVNPLQHIPVASKYYQEATGDTASEGAMLVGGAVFGVLAGGILGLATALVNAAVRHGSGKDLPEHALALIQNETETPVELAESLTEDGEPAEAAGTSREKNEPASSAEVPAHPQRTEPANFFVDAVAAQSLHPAERLLAISSYREADQEEDGSESPRHTAENKPETSIKHKLSETYRGTAAEVPGQSWGEV